MDQQLCRLLEDKRTRYARRKIFRLCPILDIALCIQAPFELRQVRFKRQLEPAGEGCAGELRALIGVEACRASASSSAAIQEPVSIVFDMRQARTARLAQ